MYSEALRRFEPEAGVTIPAMSRTLQRLLSLSLQPGVTTSEVIAAIELDPALLLSFISASSVRLADFSNWHSVFPLPMMQAMALAAASKATQSVAVKTENSDAAWRRALKRSLLAASLAKKTGADAATEIRLVGLVSEVDAWLSFEGTDVDEQAASYLSTLGCSNAVCDAVRYQGNSLDELQGTYLVVRINAVAGYLIDQISRKESIAAEKLESICGLLNIAEPRIDEVIDDATLEYKRIMNLIGNVSTLGRQSSSTTLSEATMGAAFYRALMKSIGTVPLQDLLTQMARFLLGSRAICHFNVAGSELVTALEGSALTININAGNSVVAECFRHERIVRVAGTELELIVEQQLFASLGDSHMLCLPLGKQAGVLALSIGPVDLSSHGILLGAMADAALDSFARTRELSGRSDLILTVDQVRKKAREITHEVRNPLAIMQNFLWTLGLKLGDDSVVKSELKTMSEELKRISNIIEKYAEIGSEPTLSYRVVCLNKMLEGIVLLVRSGVPEIHFETEFDEQIPEIELAEDAIKQVVLNVLKNAVEAVGQTDTALIRITTEGAINLNGKPYLEIVISDNGPGMSQQQRLDLFNDEVSSKGRGRGLGLGIVRQLLDEMSGMISCRSAGSGIGSSFQILIPVEQSGKR